MTTIDERRRAAAKLRKTRVYTLQGRGDDGSVSEWSVALMSELAAAVGLEEFRGIDVYERLADLIEPSDPEGTCGNCRHFIKDRFMPCDAAHGHTEADVSACEDFSPLSCDRDAERTCRIVSAKEAGRTGYAPACSACGWQSAVWEQYSYCPNCGARVEP